MRDLITALHAKLGTPVVSALAPVVPAKPTRIDAATDSSTATVWIYDAIGMGGVDAAELVPALHALRADDLQVRVHSPGGDYFAGVAIANALAEHPARVTVHVDGLAASAASVVAMAGDHVVMHPGAQMMIHDALTLTIGNAAEHEHTRDLLDAASQDIAALYAARSGQRTTDEWRTDMKSERWMTGEQAVAAGLAHEHIVSAPGAPLGNDTDRWAAVLAVFRTPEPSPAALPTAGDQPAPTPVRRSPIAALFGPVSSERKTG